MTPERRGRGALLLRIALPVTILIAFALATEWLVGWQSLLYPWLFLDAPARLVLCAVLVVATYVVRAVRIHRYFGIPGGFGRCLRLLLQHNALVTLLPLRTGEIAFPALMSSYFGVPVQRSVPGLLWLRALDLYVLVGIAVVLVAPIAASTAAALALAWIASPIVAFVYRRRLARRVVPAAGGGRVVNLLASLVAAVPDSGRELLENIALTLLNWTIKLAVFAWVILEFSTASYRASLAGAIGGEAVAVLPIQGFAGFGTYEAGVVAAMHPYGVSVSTALTGAANLHLLSLGVSVSAALLSLLIPAPGLHLRENLRRSLATTRLSFDGRSSIATGKQPAA